MSYYDDYSLDESFDCENQQHPLPVPLHVRENNVACLGLRPKTLRATQIGASSSVDHDYLLERYRVQLGDMVGQIYNREDADYLYRCASRIVPRNRVLIGVDLEAWEKNRDYITEIGFAIYDPRGQESAMMPDIFNVHIKIRDNAHLRNGEYVPDNFHGFNGPKSFVMNRTQAVSFAQAIFDYYCGSQGPHMSDSLWIGHGIDGDLQMLRNMGVNFVDTLYGIDTKKLFEISYGSKGANVAMMLTATQIPYARLHNAANDAYYTLLACMKMSHPQLRECLEMDDPGFRHKCTQKYGSGVGIKQHRFNEETPERNFPNASQALSVVFGWS